MTPQEELAKYFEVCGYAPDDLITIGTRAKEDGPIHFTLVTVADAPRQITARSKVNCWFGANPIRELPPRQEGKETRGTAADVVAIRALWADIDVKPGGMPDQRSAKGVMQELARLLGCRPVAIVRSGHGFQPRWRIDIGELPEVPLDGELSREGVAGLIERFGRLVQLVSERLGGKADPVYDLARIIRAPHTMNIKPGMKPVETGVWLYDHGQSLSIERLVEVLDEYVPETASASSTSPAADSETRHVGLERGNAYVRGAIDQIRSELAEIADWPVGKSDDRGRGWEKIQADAAYRLAGLAKAAWNSLELEEAKNLFVVACPKDEHWTVRDVIKKWNSQVKRAEAAPPPPDVTDPLAPGARPAGDATPLRSAAASDVWNAAASRDDGPAGQAGGEHGGQLPAAPRPSGASAGHGGVDPAVEEGLSWRKYSWDDFGNADRTVALYGSILRYSPLMKRWLRYEDGAWRESETGGERCVQDMLRQLWGLEGSLYSDVVVREGKKASSERDKFGDWLENQRSAAKVTAAARVIRNSGDLDVVPAVFDSEPMLLNAPNGIIDLATGELLEHDPSLLLRRQIPVKYDPDAKAPRWEAFLEQVMPSVDMRDYLQRIVGYSITGRTSEQVVFFHVGKPAAGKSVFLRIIESILGEFSRVVPPTTLLNKKMEQHPTDVMGMEGRRMLQVSETPEGARLDEALLKRLSGEETITARGMGENFRDFRLVGKVHLVSNHPPHLSDDPAVARRLHYVRWDNPVPVEQRDPFLADFIIAEELEGVLAWAVRGTKRWVEDRLAKPAEAEMALSAYLSDEDEFGHFMEEELVLGAESFTESKMVYQRYRRWCEAQGMKAMSAVAFGRKLSSRGVEPARTTKARGFKVALAVLQPSPWMQDPLA